MHGRDHGGADRSPTGGKVWCIDVSDTPRLGVPLYQDLDQVELAMSRAGIARPTPKPDKRHAVDDRGEPDHPATQPRITHPGAPHATTDEPTGSPPDSLSDRGSEPLSGLTSRGGRIFGLTESELESGYRPSLQ